jgi:hypothetical protein
MEENDEKQFMETFETQLRMEGKMHSLINIKRIRSEVSNQNKSSNTFHQFAPLNL